MKRNLLMTLVLLAAALSWGQDLTLLVVPKSQDQDYWVAVRRGVQKALDEDGQTKLIWRGPATNNDTDQQIAILVHYLDHPTMDGILLCPTDQDRLVAPVKRARAQGVPVVVFDSQLAEAMDDGYVATDNRRGGAAVAAALLATPQAPKAVVLLRTVKGSASTEDRAEGFRAALAAAGGRTVVDDVYGGGTQGDLTRAAVALVGRHGAEAAYFAVNESATLGLLNALQKSPVRRPPFAWGFDSTPAIEAAVATGQLTGTTAQDPERIGYEAARRLIARLRGHPEANPVLLLPTVNHGPAGAAGR